MKENKNFKVGQISPGFSLVICHASLKVEVYTGDFFEEWYEITPKTHIRKFGEQIACGVSMHTLLYLMSYLNTSRCGVSIGKVCIVKIFFSLGLRLFDLTIIII